MNNSTIQTMRKGGLSRRGFLRALGITSASVLVPGLAIKESACPWTPAEAYKYPSWAAPVGFNVCVSNVGGQNWYRYVDHRDMKGMGNFKVEIVSTVEMNDLKVQLRLPDDGILSLTPRKVKA